MTTFTTGATSLVGQVRSANEDAYLVTDDLVAVADGMGGHRAGEVASADTVEVLRAAGGSRAVEDLVAAVHRANRRINERAAESDELRGMGTTVCVVGQVRYDDEDQIAVLNVGDSRVYLFADGKLDQLTEDHSLVETLLREGRISAEEAEHHPRRNVITRALGVEALVVVDAWLLSPCDGDRLLLCSDGLFGEVGKDRIAEILGEGDDPAVTARRLAAEADAAGGRDNITTVVVDISGTGEPAASIEGRWRRISTPAVDMSDPDDDGPHTATVMTVVAPPVSDVGSSHGEVDDETDETDEAYEPAVDDGPGSEMTGDDEADPGTETPDEDEPLGDTDPQRQGRPWRTALFVLAVSALIAVMATVLVVWSRTGWVVTDDRGVVVLVQGPKNGLPLIGPLVVERHDDLPVSELTDADRLAVGRGTRFTSRSDAEQFIGRLARPTTTTTTTTTTTSTTTTMPATTVGSEGIVVTPPATGP